jgi:hypothetical protein
MKAVYVLVVQALPSGWGHPRPQQRPITQVSSLFLRPATSRVAPETGALQPDEASTASGEGTRKLLVSGSVCGGYPGGRKQTDMRTTGEEYLSELAGFPEKSFPNRFSSIASLFSLGRLLDREELVRLYEAAFAAVLCNIAFNGLGGCCGRIRPQDEPNRRRLEREFMIARARLDACVGWQTLPPGVRNPIQQSFLRVVVDDDKLAA